MSAPAIESLVEELLQATGLLVRRLRTETNPEGLTWSQTVVMARLDREGPATTADLARAEGVKPQSMGATLAGLERDGLVARRAHPSDGRQFLFELTPRGAAVRAERQLLKRSWLAAAVERLDHDEVEALATALAVMRRLSEA